MRIVSVHSGERSIIPRAMSASAMEITRALELLIPAADGRLLASAILVESAAPGKLVARRRTTAAA